MKKLFVILAILFCAACVNAYTLSWNDTSDEDGYIVYYKSYPAGYSYPANPAPNTAIQNMDGATTVNVAANTVEWDLPPANFTAGSRYVFMVRATKNGSVSGESDFVCWTYPVEGQVIELPIESGGDIQINIYQQP